MFFKIHQEIRYLANLFFLRYTNLIAKMRDFYILSKKLKSAEVKTINYEERYSSKILSGSSIQMFLRENILNWFNQRIR